MPRLKGSAERLEARRRRALVLLDQGYSLQEIGRLMGCAPSSVMRWRNARRRGGQRALAVRASPGRPPTLSTLHCRRLITMRLKGPLAHGYVTDLWTTARVAEIITRAFGVTYHRDHVGRLLQRLGWSHQKPERRALERDDDAIARWKQRAWPRIKKKLPGWAPASSSSMNRGAF